LEPIDFEILPRLIDLLIDTAEPTRGEYYRGYREGSRIRRLAGRSIENFRRYKSNKDSGGRYLADYIRGFNDGCKGVMPESLSDLLHTLRAS